MGDMIPFPDRTPKSFDPVDWDEALKNGGYWWWGPISEAWFWCPVRDTDAREKLIRRTMAQHGLSRREAIEMLDQAGM